MSSVWLHDCEITIVSVLDSDCHPKTCERQRRYNYVTRLLLRSQTGRISGGYLCGTNTKFEQPMFVGRRANRREFYLQDQQLVPHIYHHHHHEGAGEKRKSKSANWHCRERQFAHVTHNNYSGKLSPILLVTANYCPIANGKLVIACLKLITSSVCSKFQL